MGYTNRFEGFDDEPRSLRPASLRTVITDREILAELDFDGSAVVGEFADDQIDQFRAGKIGSEVTGACFDPSYMTRREQRLNNRMTEAVVERSLR
jgi:hypothetical protein